MTRARHQKKYDGQSGGSGLVPRPGFQGAIGMNLWKIVRDIGARSAPLRRVKRKFQGSSETLESGLPRFGG